MGRTNIDYCIPISYPGIDSGKYGIYRDGTVVNFYTKNVLKAYSRKGEKVVDLHGYTKITQAPIAKLLAMVYIKKSKEDIERERNCVVLKDKNVKVCIKNIKWANKLERKIILELQSKEGELTNTDYIIPICKLLAKGYDVDEISRVLDFSNKLYIYNIKNRRIHKDISKKYKW